IRGARFELAMNIKADDPERARLRDHGWHVVDPHRVARTPTLYWRYIGSALAEFTAVKGVDVRWRTGWLSDRGASFLAAGRPVITEDTGATKYLPEDSGFFFVRDLNETKLAVEEILARWPTWSRKARACAVEVFDSKRNVQRILGF